jgi:hypothetical protein
MILLSSHFRETGFVKKSLQPAANALTRSWWNDEAVRATMMTDDRRGVPDAATSATGLRVLWESKLGVDGKNPILLFFSDVLISLVASIPSITGSWMSIYQMHVIISFDRQMGRLMSRLTRIKWNIPVFHFSTAS